MSATLLAQIAYCLDSVWEQIPLVCIASTYCKSPSKERLPLPGSLTGNLDHMVRALAWAGAVHTMAPYSSRARPCSKHTSPQRRLPTCLPDPTLHLGRNNMDWRCIASNSVENGPGPRSIDSEIAILQLCALRGLPMLASVVLVISYLSNCSLQSHDVVLAAASFLFCFPFFAFGPRALALILSFKMPHRLDASRLPVT